MNRPIVELEAAAQEELKITELRLAKLFSSEPTVSFTTIEGPTIQSDKAAGINSILSVCRFFYTKMSAFFTYMFENFVVSILYLYASYLVLTCPHFAYSSIDSILSVQFYHVWKFCCFIHIVYI